MTSTPFLASVALFAAFVGNAALAGEDHHDRDRGVPGRAHAHLAGTAGQGMLAVANDAGPQQSGHGWQYFSDPAARRAVVISPQGDYYYSRGKGLRRVAGPASGA
jgi:hypothetical protein